MHLYMLYGHGVCVHLDTEGIEMVPAALLSIACVVMQANLSTGPSEDYLMGPMASLQSSIAASSLAASSLNSAGWGSSLESASVVRVSCPSTTDDLA